MDEIICFQPLTDTEILRIAQLMLNRSLQRLRDQAISVQYTTPWKRWLNWPRSAYGVAYAALPAPGLKNPAAELLLPGYPVPGEAPFLWIGEHLSLPTAPLPILLVAGNHAVVPKVPEKKILSGTLCVRFLFSAMISSMGSRSSMWCLTPLIS